MNTTEHQNHDFMSVQEMKSSCPFQSKDKLNKDGTRNPKYDGIMTTVLLIVSIILIPSIWPKKLDHVVSNANHINKDLRGRYVADLPFLRKSTFSSCIRSTVESRPMSTGNNAVQFLLILRKLYSSVKKIREFIPVGVKCQQ
jgi:hypothetical protein